MARVQEEALRGIILLWLLAPRCGLEHSSFAPLPVPDAQPLLPRSREAKMRCESSALVPAPRVQRKRQKNVPCPSLPYKTPRTHAESLREQGIVFCAGALFVNRTGIRAADDAAVALVLLGSALRVHWRLSKFLVVVVAGFLSLSGLPFSLFDFLRARPTML